MTDPPIHDDEEPDDETLPPKPPIDYMPKNVQPPADEEEQDVLDDEFLSETEAADDPTVDDAETE